jgi:hypothetical protein
MRTEGRWGKTTLTGNCTMSADRAQTLGNEFFGVYALLHVQLASAQDKQVARYAQDKDRRWWAIVQGRLYIYRSRPLTVPVLGDLVSEFDFRTALLK